MSQNRVIYYSIFISGNEGGMQGKNIISVLMLSNKLYNYVLLYNLNTK